MIALWHAVPVLRAKHASGLGSPPAEPLHANGLRALCLPPRACPHMPYWQFGWVAPAKATNASQQTRAYKGFAAGGAEQIAGGASVRHEHSARRLNLITWRYDKCIEGLEAQSSSLRS